MGSVIMSVFSGVIARSSIGGNPWLVTLLGVATVFIGLAALILLVKLMGAAGKDKRSKADSGVEKGETSLKSEDELLAGPRRREVIAAISAALAVYMGTDMSGLRIRSIKRVQ